MLNPYLIKIFGVAASIIALSAFLYKAYWYIHDKGYNSCVVEYSQKSADAERESLKGARDVKKFEQSLDDGTVIAELCALGIVREQDACR